MTSRFTYTFFVMSLLTNLFAEHSTSFEKAVKACHLLLGNPEIEEKIKAQDYIDYARKKAQQQDHKAALYGFEMALKSDPSRRFEILNEYADQLSFNSQAHLAIPFYLEIIKANPSEEAKLHAEKGLLRAYSWTNQLEAALQEYQDILAQEPNNQEVKSGLRSLYLQLARKSASESNHKAAADFFLKAIDVDPRKRLELLREYADQLSFNSQAHLAIPFYQEAIQANLSRENRLQSHLGLARAYGWTGKEEEALQEYQLVLSIDPTNLEAKREEKKIKSQIWSQYARKMGIHGNYKEAIHWFAKAIEIDPSRRKELLKEYADQLSYNSQQTEAIPLYQELLNTNLPPKESFAIHFSLAEAFYWTEQYEKSLEQYHIALALEQNNYKVMKRIKEVQEKIKNANKKKEAADEFQRGLCFEKRLEIFQAMEAFKKSLTYDPENNDVQIHYAWFLHNFGFPEEAVQQLCHILTIFKDKRAIYQTLGWTYRELGNFESSFEAFSYVYPCLNYKNPNNQFIKISKCQENETRLKEIDLINKIFCFMDWGALRFSRCNLDSFLYCNLLKRVGCKKNCDTQSFESRNLRMLQKVSCAPFLCEETKHQKIKELLNLYSYTGNPPQAFALAQYLIGYDPEDYYAYLLYINALMNKRNYREAFCEYLQLIKLLPGNAFLYFRLGEAYEKTGLLYSAKLSYELALSFDKNNRIQRAYSRVLAKLGCCEEAFSLSQEMSGEEEPFLSKTLSLAEMYQNCGCISQVACYYQQLLECFPYNRCALYGILQNSAFIGDISNTHLATQQLAYLPYPNWKEGKFIQYYKPPQINSYLDYFKDITKFAIFDAGITYDFYKNHNLRILGGFLYSNFKQLHFDRMDRYGATLHVDKLCNNSEINFQVDNYFYNRISMPPNHISSSYLHMIMPTTSIRPIPVPTVAMDPAAQPTLNNINSISNSGTSFRHSKNSINFYSNYQHFWTNLNVNFGYRYYDVINTTPIFNNYVFNYALQYGAVALNIKTQDVYGSFYYFKNKLSLQGNVVYGRYSLENNKQSRWFSLYYSLLNLPEVRCGYTYFYLNFSHHAPFFIEKGYFQRAYYDPKNFETHTAQLYTRFTPTDYIEYKLIGYLFYTPKSNCIGKAFEIDFRYLFNENYSIALQFSGLQQSLSVGRDGLLDGYQALYGLLNLKYGF